MSTDASVLDVPRDLTAPSKRYRNTAWLAVLSLLAFLTGYVALAGWLGWTCYRLLAASLNGSSDGSIFIGLGAGFLSVFLFKALFFIERSKASEDIEITPADQPRLFAFIFALADEVGARRPKRVFLSSNVNAGVFYDLSPLNLVIPSKKNLEIGLALVNVLNLGELRAVLAHEFGHFAQRTMAVGRWVYVAQRVAAHVVHKRDAFDSFLVGLSRVDLRIGWVGWLLRAIVWSIRSIVELLFTGVALAQRALSREMEFQADLVSVSVTGSDALINALHKLHAADDAWRRAVGFGHREKTQHGQEVGDLFAVQQTILQKMAYLLGDPGHGVSPRVPQSDPHSFRVFRSSLAAPPQMWSTHPANADREENAKRRYVSAKIDDRSAWTLFENSEALRIAVSQRVLGTKKGESALPAESAARLDAEYKVTQLDPAYRGVYLGRALGRHAQTIDDLYAESLSNPIAALDSLYPESIAHDLELRKILVEEVALLEGVSLGVLKTPEGVVRYRGRVVSKREIPALKTAVERQLAEVNARIHDHDRLCRTTHVALSRSVGDGWGGYLRGLLSVHHYSTHAEALLSDAGALYQRTLAHELRGGTSRRPKIKAILAAAQAAYAPLARVHAEADKLWLDERLRRSLGATTWAEKIQPLKLPAPTQDSLGEWIKVFGSWMDSAIANLSRLRFQSLEELLETERVVREAAVEGRTLPQAPTASSTPDSYACLLPGQEVSRPKAKSGLGRLTDRGGGVARAASLAVALGIVALAVRVASQSGLASVTVYNGLGIPVHVTLGSSVADVGAFGHTTVQVPDGDPLHVHAATADGRTIEDFDARISGPGEHDVYNVDSAGVLVSWVATYGNAVKIPPNVLGTPHWMNARSDAEFQPPPESISAKYGGGTRSVLTGFSSERPDQVLGPLGKDKKSAFRVIQEHAKWDDPRGQWAAEWKSLAARVESGDFGSL